MRLNGVEHHASFAKGQKMQIGQGEVEQGVASPRESFI
jgi:hypothetical protein